MQLTKTISTAALAACALSLSLNSAQADPIIYNGTGTILPPIAPAVFNQNGFLGDFFPGDVPEVGDAVSFRAVFDPDSVIPDPGATNTAELAFFLGGITEISFTVGNTTLNAIRSPYPAARESAIIVTTADDDQLLIPGFRDGYAITAGSPLTNDPRWGVNLFFTGAFGGLTSLDQLTELPNPDDFQFVGFGFRSFRGSIFDGFGAFLDTLEVEDPNNGGGGPVNPPTTVSEPGTLAFMLGGLAVGATIRRRRK